MKRTDDVAKRVLPNGLTILAQRDSSANVVAVVTHVRAGYFDEPDELVGVSHVLEHMFFKGTDRRGPGQIARETQLAGGYINAATIYDKTVYYTVLPSAEDGLAKALDIQADALMHAALDREELRRELIVIIEEAKRKLDTPSAVAVESLYEVLFAVHRMRRWRIGTEEQLRQLTVEALRSYYTSRYVPRRVIVGIAGDIVPEQALDLAAKTYGAWNVPEVPVPGSPPEPNEGEARAKLLRGDVERPIALLGWKTVGPLHPDAAALDMAAAVLASGRGSRLYRALRQPGLVSGATAFHYTPSEVGVFAVTLESESDRLDAAVERAVGLIAELGSEAPSLGELARVKALFATQWARHFETMDGRAAVLCEAEALGDYRLADELYQRTLAVRPEDVHGVIPRYLETERVCGVLYLPDSATTRWGNGSWPPRVATAPDELRVVQARSVVGDRSGEHSPRVQHLEELPGEIALERRAGADVLVRPKHGSGLVTLGIHLPGTRAAEDSATAGVRWLLARAALRGAGALDAEQLAEAAERLGGTIGPSVSTDAMGWWITVPSEGVRHAAELLRQVALEPSLAPDQVAVERDLLASDARSVRDDMFRYPVQQVRGQAFPEDAYGLPALGDPETVGNLADGVVSDWADRLRSQRAIVVAVGDLAAEELASQVATLADWPALESIRPNTTPRWHPGRATEEREKQQTALAMAFATVSHRSPERHAISVLCSLLSGLAGRLFDELRERRSLAYTVAAMPWLADRAGAIVTYIATSPEREEEARHAMLEELQRVATAPMDPTEVERARRYAAGIVEVRRQSGRAIADELLASWIHGTTAELASVPERLRAVTEDDVRRVAESVFREEQRAEYVVRGTMVSGRGK